MRTKDKTYIYMRIGVMKDSKTKAENVYRVVYYESRKRQLEIRLMNEGRYNERLKAGVEGLRILLIMNQESES